MGRLVLSRLEMESVFVGETKVTVVSVKGKKVRLAFEAPDHVVIVRQELMAEEADE